MVVNENDHFVMVMAVMTSAFVTVRLLLGVMIKNIGDVYDAIDNDGRKKTRAFIL